MRRALKTAMIAGLVALASAPVRSHDEWARKDLGGGGAEEKPDNLDCYCEYLEEHGGSDVVLSRGANIAKGFLAKGTPLMVVNDLLYEENMRLEPIDTQRVCTYRLEGGSQLCNSYFSMIIRLDSVLLDIDGDMTPEQIVFDDMWRPGIPKVTDRIYLTGSVDRFTAEKRDGTVFVRITNDPVTTITVPIPAGGCYFPRVDDVNDDGNLDLAIANPYRIRSDERGMHSDEVRLCGDGNGHYSKKLCKPKRDTRPPHLRITHPHR